MSCVRPFFKCAKCDRNFARFLAKKTQISHSHTVFCKFLGKTDQNLVHIPTLFSMLFHSLIAPEFELVTSINKKVKNLLQKFAVFKMCVCECALNFGKTHTCVRCACGRKLKSAVCVRASQKSVATHTLSNIQITFRIMSKNIGAELTHWYKPSLC